MLATPSGGSKPPMKNYVEKKDHPENILFYSPLRAVLAPMFHLTTSWGKPSHDFSESYVKTP